ncbi:MAG: ATP-dependent 6-phosphofructokinase [Gemmatimonadetes bacterium]|nr:ATP-dependent 6-phosphofructokinase [Gemmatimonadota bacterium]
MEDPIRKIAITTGGGDAPGLNAVIRAAVITALNLEWEVCGIRRGYSGLLDEDTDGIERLDRRAVRGITHLGGTILGTTNRGNPFDWPVERPGGTVTSVDRSDELLANFRRHGLDALIAIGGDGSLYIANRLYQKGLPVVGVPKTIDNDLACTEVTFGFHTAVETATEALDKLHSTAESHERVFVVELMGRHTGWIALYAGISATADVILIPEIPFEIEKVCEKVEVRYASGARFAIIVAAEGAAPKGGAPVYREHAGPGRNARLGGIGEWIAREVAERTGHEVRSLILGHLQRGGQPTAYDRLLALRFGAAAARFVAEGRFGTMVALDSTGMRAVPLAEAISQIKRVPPAGEIVRTARDLRISFGD